MLSSNNCRLLRKLIEPFLFLFFLSILSGRASVLGKGTGGAIEANGMLGILTMGGVGGLEQDETKAKALWERSENAGIGQRQG